MSQAVKQSYFKVQAMDQICRRYLENDGFGAGTPGQRQRQHQQIRAMQAAESVRKHRVEKLREKDEDAWVGIC